MQASPHCPAGRVLGGIRTAHQRRRGAGFARLAVPPCHCVARCQPVLDGTVPGRQRARAVAVPVDAKMWVCRLGAGLLMPMFWGVEVGWCALRIGP